MEPWDQSPAASSPNKAEQDLVMSKLEKASRGREPGCWCAAVGPWASELPCMMTMRVLSLSWSPSFSEHFREPRVHLTIV